MAGKKLDESYKVYSGFKGTQPGLTNRQMKSIMKSLQKIKIKKIGMEDGGDVVPVPKERPKNFKDIVSINFDNKSGNNTQKQKIQAARNYLQPGIFGAPQPQVEPPRGSLQNSIGMNPLFGRAFAGKPI